MTVSKLMTELEKLRLHFSNETTNDHNRVLSMIAKHIKSILALELNFELFSMYIKREPNESIIAL